MVARVAQDVEDDWIVNVGVGLPTGVLPHLRGRSVLLQSENGILGMGPPPEPGQEDPDVVDAGKGFATFIPGAAFMDSSVSFAMIRSGRLDLAVLGAYQISERGDLANWKLPGQKSGGIGGAADIAHGARRIFAITLHTTRDGAPKLVASCTYPLTAYGVVDRVFTDLGVFDVTPEGFAVRELAPNVSLEMVSAATTGRLVMPPLMAR
jgi:3-oxoacid CoA-transferase subunit B